MHITEKIFEKTFTGKSTKDAYLKASKWIATNVVSTKHADKITYKFIKKPDALYKNDIIVILYIDTDEETIKDRHCEICQEVSSAFYMSSNKNMCDSCKMIPYRNRVKQQLKQMETGIKETTERWQS